MLKKILPIAVILVLLGTSFAEEKHLLEHLNMGTFKDKVFDYDIDKEWNYKGELPAIIDFYADWCGPCRKVAPIMEELAQEYKGKIIIYKVDTVVEKQLAGMFGISSIPAILFIPKEGQPQMTTGALPKTEYEKLIKEILKVE
jgi:thioredoxin